MARRVGRPPARAGDRKEKRIIAAFTASECKAIDLACKKKGMSRMAFVRAAVIDKI